MRNEVAFLSLLKNQTTGFIKRFTIKLTDLENGRGGMRVSVLNDDANNFARQSTWLSNIFLPKLVKWNVSIDDYDTKSKLEFSGIESLSLINLMEYNQLYNDLKIKYGEHMVKVTARIRWSSKHLA